MRARDGFSIILNSETPSVVVERIARQMKQGRQYREARRAFVNIPLWTRLNRLPLPGSAFTVRRQRRAATSSGTECMNTLNAQHN